MHWLLCLEGQISFRYLAHRHFDTAGNTGWTTNPLIREQPVLVPEPRPLLSLESFLIQKWSYVWVYIRCFLDTKSQWGVDNLTVLYKSGPFLKISNYFLWFSQGHERLIYSWIHSAGSCGKKLCGFCLIRFPFWKCKGGGHQKKTLVSCLQPWPRASSVLGGCSGYALEWIRTTWSRTTVGLRGIFSQACGLTACGRLDTVACDKVLLVHIL